MSSVRVSTVEVSGFCWFSMLKSSFWSLQVCSSTTTTGIVASWIRAERGVTDLGPLDAFHLRQVEATAQARQRCSPSPTLNASLGAGLTGRAGCRSTTPSKTSWLVE